MFDFLNNPFFWRRVRQLLRQGTVVALRGVWTVALALITVAIAALMRLRLRTRVAAALAVLVCLSSFTHSLAPSVSTALSGVAVLVLAGFGLWMIVAAPRRRRW